MVDRVVSSRRLLTPHGFRDGAVLIEAGKIKEVVDRAQIPSGLPTEEAGDLVVMPGLFDSHVHVNEPGRTEWEGFETATKAALAGGITTIVDMPLNCIPVTTSPDAFKTKLASITNRLYVDCAFWGGVVPGNTRLLDKMIDQGVVGFKCFLIHSGIDDFPNVEKMDLDAAIPILAKRGVPLLVHAELESAHEPWPHGYHTSYKKFLESRPRKWENDAIKLMIELCRKHDCRVHIVHLSSAEALDDILHARNAKLPFTTESCPHYLTFNAENIPDGDTRYKCAPPIREKENQEKLWKALKEGTIDFIVSDHSPCTPELKHLEAGDFERAWGGISSVQFGLPTIWTEAQKRGHSLADVINWMSAAPAKFVGLDNQKGAIEAGRDADLVVFDPDKEFVIEKKMIHHRHKETPHEGRTLTGVVQTVFLRGEEVYRDGEFVGGPHGQPIKAVSAQKTARK